MGGSAAPRTPDGDAPRTGRIGPNAITRFAEALAANVGEAMTAQVFAQAGLAHHLHRPPAAMVAEGDVVALHRAARALLPPPVFEAVARDAGARTARYLLAHRIPPAVQRLLRLLPPALAAWVLARAIARHAWTFVGSGRFRIDRGPPLAFVIADGPLARALHTPAPACGYFAATFEGLFRALVHPDAQVVETACQAAGATVCVFTVTWPSGFVGRRRATGHAAGFRTDAVAPPTAG